MLVMKSYFLSEVERYQMETIVLGAMKDLSEAEILDLDDRELMELADKCKKKELI
ncbi:MULTISPECIES: hypothetical protein [Bacillaceae]|uniref:hypothetical protein n=1 Tax=Bacillaceae TaxID=186817 RepID=UPI000AA0A20A|nr:MULTISPECIES: hypothetical protein [Bacillaceae]